MKNKGFEVGEIRKDFPILERIIHGNKRLIYMDNAATTQKPRPVIDVMTKLYSEMNSNVHRGIHFLSEKVTEMYEEAREKVRKFLNAKSSSEIIFTSGTTASINLVAQCFGERYLKPNDEIILSLMEHHSNIVPWQLVSQKTGTRIRVIPINEKGELLIEEFIKLINPRTRLVAIVHVSNSLGTINPVKEIIKISHEKNIPVLVDGAQAVAHLPVDVQVLDCDFYVFSGHKIYGPTGIGVLYGKESLLREMPPYQGGGEMIEEVKFENTLYKELPFKFEAGTPNYIGAIGLGVALDYLTSIRLHNIQNYEKELLHYTTAKLTALDGIKLYGTSENKICIFSFLLNHIHPYDLGRCLDKSGIAVRAGHHCTQPLWKYYGISGTVRVSLSFYNTFEEIDYLVETLKNIQKMF